MKLAFILILLVAGCANPVKQPNPSIAPTPRSSTGTGTVTLAWDASAGPTVTGYKVYWGTSPSQYTNTVDAGNNLQVTILGLSFGVTYYFAATAYDATGDESGFSNEISYRFAIPPPTNLRLQAQAAPTISGPWENFESPITVTNPPATAQFFRLEISRSP